MRRTALALSIVLIALPAGARAQSPRSEVILSDTAELRKASQAERTAPSLHFAAFTGASFPVGSTNVDFDPSFYHGIGGEYVFSPMFRAGLRIGFHALDVEPVMAPLDNEGIVSLDLVGRALGRWGPYRPYMLLGLGAYVSKGAEGGREWDGGFQLGAGLEVPVTEAVALTTGSDIHIVLRGGEERTDLLWLNGYVGFRFAQP